MALMPSAMRETAAAIGRLVFPRQDPKQTLRLRRYFAAAGTSLLALGLIFACRLQGAIPAAAFVQIAAIVVLALVVFYGLFRSGLNLRFADPSLTEPQMLTAVAVVLFAMYSADYGRGVLLALLLMAYLFGVLHLKRRPLLLHACFILAAYAAVLVLLWRFKPQTLDARVEFLRWLALAITLPWFSLMGGYFSELRAQLRKSNVRQQRTLARVRANEGNLAEAERIARLGSWTFEPDTGATEWSPGMYRIFGIDPADAPAAGESFLQLVHPEDRRRCREMVDAALREARRCESQLRIVSRDGGTRWVDAVTEPIVEENGRIGLLRGTLIDIDERKKLEHRQALGHNVTRVVAESETIEAALPKIIKMICETFGWACGAYWQCDTQERVLRCSETWNIESNEVSEFVARCRNERYAPTDAGLIRRAWSTGEPVWIVDVSGEPTFLRASIATEAGLQGALAFPVKIRDEICGVLEFFMRNACQPDASVLAMTRSIGLEIGQFIARTTAQTQIRQLAHFDFLTGLPNRTLFNELLAHAFAKAQRYKRQLAILFIDLDGFKQINDRFGHDAGDHLLVSFTLRLRESLRRSDQVGRYSGSDAAARLGGDEFIVLIDEFSDPSELETVANRILDAAKQPFPLAGPMGQVSASIGISIYPTDGTDIETLTKCADTAMYRAKEAGKNTYRFFSAATDLRRCAELR